MGTLRYAHQRVTTQETPDDYNEIEGVVEMISLPSDILCNRQLPHESRLFFPDVFQLSLFPRYEITESDPNDAQLTSIKPHPGFINHPEIK